MGWPQSQDYNEAMQNPRSSFGDTELRGGQAVTNALGIPMPRSGNFADVYEFHGASGQKWAIKCFTRQIPGLQERYDAISKHLLQSKLPFTVDFTYLAKGIRIRSECYPILKMQWVEGFLLNEFVRDNLDKPALLDALAQIWVRMAKRLHEADIAHADLQHGNVILVPGSKASSLAVKLIDYDGMWVPSLAQKKSGELGHPAYQHPQRLQQGIYSADVDRLPLLAIACALRCLALGGKALWDKYDNGDNMLFREADLRNPKASGLFKELWRINDPAPHDLTGYLAIALSGGLDQVPLLPDLINGNHVRPLSALEENLSAGLLGPGAILNRSPSIAVPIKPQTKVYAAPAPTKTSPEAGSSTPEWNFIKDGEPSTLFVRKSAKGNSTKVWLGVGAMVGLLIIAGVGVWVSMQKDKPSEAGFAQVKKQIKMQDRPAVKSNPPWSKKDIQEPDQLAESSDEALSKKENKQPVQPDEKPDPALNKNESKLVDQPEEKIDPAKNQIMEPMFPKMDKVGEMRPPPDEAAKPPIPEKSKIVDVDQAGPAKADNKPGSIPTAPFKITLALVKTKFKGKVNYDSKSATLTLAYDFNSSAQLKDFDVDKAKSSLQGGFLHLLPNGRVQHSVKFTEVTVAGVVFVKSMTGTLLSTTGGIRVSLGGNNPDTMYLDSGKGHAEFIVPAKERTGNVAFGFQIQPSKVTFAYGVRNLSLQTMEAQAGFVEFFGGNVGFSFDQLILSGKMDEDWAQAFFALPSRPAPMEKNAAIVK